MDCYVCESAGATRSATGVCTHCGAALCRDHFEEADRYRIGGMRFGCAHASGAVASAPHGVRLGSGEDGGRLGT